MTAAEAKELSLEVWRYLRDHPEITDKADLPEEINYRIRNISCECPLCEFFGFPHRTGVCRKCPLETTGTRCGCQNSGNHTGVYELWSSAESSEERQFYAREIVERIENWNIEDLIE